jgi:hypothetical protein
LRPGSVVKKISRPESTESLLDAPKSVAGRVHACIKTTPARLPITNENRSDVRMTINFIVNNHL